MSTDTTPHSPLPWEAHDVAQYTYIRHSFGDEIGAMRSPHKATQHANAALIVTAVNERASLLAEWDALKAALEGLLDEVRFLWAETGRTPTSPCNPVAVADAALAQGRDKPLDR